MTEATAGSAAPEARGAAGRPEAAPGPMLAADGTPLKKSLQRALRREKLRALMLVAPLLIFILVSFIAPIADMLFRSVENEIVSDTLPRTTASLEDWDYDSGVAPGPEAYEALYFDIFTAAEVKTHTRLGTRLNYETTGVSSLFRQAGRGVDDIGEDVIEAIEDAHPDFGDPAAWEATFLTEDGAGDAGLAAAVAARTGGIAGKAVSLPEGVLPAAAAVALAPRAAAEYTSFAMITHALEEDVIAEEDPWEAVFAALALDVASEGFADRLAAYDGPGRAAFEALLPVVPTGQGIDFKAAFLDEDEDWADPEIWGTIKAFAPPYTSGYFLSSVDLKKTPAGIAPEDEDQRIYILLFERTLFMSLVIMASCILLGYPIAYLLATLPLRTSNVLLILVLLPFWTSLLVRTSAWKVLLQQQGVINDILVWMGFVGDTERLVMINNQFGTIVAMTHILLPFMILPLYSVMKTIPPSYVRAAKSLGATNWTAFWRVYFPQSVPGIGAGCILVFILAIGYYITPELVGGTTGTFISNRIAYHISSSLNWGLAAALGTILLAVVLLLYWVYDRIVGIDNVSLG
jgi:putative spermidine/putrescine transport system permease protein